MILRVCFIVSVNCLLDAFIICPDVAAVLLLNAIVLFCVDLFCDISENLGSVLFLVRAVSLTLIFV